jgi:hypothetical protein
MLGSANVVGLGLRFKVTNEWKHNSCVTWNDL